MSFGTVNARSLRVGRRTSRALLRVQALLRACGALLAATLTLLAARPAAAVEEKIHMGSSCVPTDSFQQGSLAVSDRNYLKNVGAGTATVICPAIKAVPNNSRIDQVYVYVDHGTTTKTTSCKMVAHQSNVTGANPPNPLESTNASAMGTGVKVVAIENFANSGSLAAPWGSDFRLYTLQCSLPQNATLRSYVVREAGTGDETKKTYPPSMCRPDSGGSTGKWTHHPAGYMQMGQGSGPQPGNVKVTCPVITDRKVNSAASLVAQMSVGRPITSGLSFQCGFYATGNYSNVLSHVLSNSVAYNGSAFPSVTLDLDINSGADWARYYMECNMPATGDSKILGYRVEEAGSTNDAATADGKVYPGSFCIGQTPVPLFSTNTTLPSGAYKYNGVGYTYASCPVINNNYNNASGLSVAKVYVQETNLEPYNTTSCSITAAMASLDTPVSTTTAVALEPTSGTTRNQSLSLAFSTGTTGARYSLSCRLGNGATLYEYEIEER